MSSLTTPLYTTTPPSPPPPPLPSQSKWPIMHLNFPHLINWRVSCCMIITRVHSLLHLWSSYDSKNLDRGSSYTHLQPHDFTWRHDFCAVWPNKLCLFCNFIWPTVHKLIDSLYSWLMKKLHMALIYLLYKVVKSTMSYWKKNHHQKKKRDRLIFHWTRWIT